MPQIVNVADLNGDSNPDLIVNAPGTTIVNFQLQRPSSRSISQKATAHSSHHRQLRSERTRIACRSSQTLTKTANSTSRFWLKTGPGQAELAISLGKGDGTFAAPRVISNLAGGDAIRSSELAAADFDDDGNIDLALFDSNDFSGIFYGKGAGTFTSVPFNGNIVPKDLINVAAGGVVQPSLSISIRTASPTYSPEMWCS